MIQRAALVLTILALGCGETTTDDGGSSGSGGSDNTGGNGGSGAMGGDDGMGGASGSGAIGGNDGTGGASGSGGTSGCQGPDDCNDADECTEDLCDPTVGTCSNPTLPDGASCEAGSGQCVSGICTGLCELVDCDDSNECTLDSCDPTDGRCSNSPLTNGTTCPFGEVDGQCQTGVCVSLCKDVNCSDGKQCTEDICNVTNGSCTNPDRADGTSCELGTELLPGRCASGVCVDAELCSAVDCSDGKECTDDVCDPRDASCSNPSRADDTECTAGDNPGRCDDGLCLGLCEGVICEDGNQCTLDLCDPSDGSCPNPAVADGTPCDLGVNPGKCDSGICVGLCVGVDCNDDNECTTDTCDPSSGWCDNTDRVNGTTCDLDGTPGKCIAGSCTRVREWGTPVRIGANMADAINPQVATDALGNAIAIWYQDDGETSAVGANRFTPSSGWGQPVVISGPPGQVGGGNPPRVAIDAGGNAVAVWYEASKIWFNRFTLATGWVTASRIDTGVLYLEDKAGFDPEVAVRPDGSAMAIWRVNISGVDYELWSNTYTPEGGWGQPERVIEPRSLMSRMRVAVAPDGSAIAVWEHGSVSFDPVILSSRFDPGTGWGPYVTLENDARRNGLGLASIASGDAIAIYGRESGGIGSYRYDPEDGWATESERASTDGGGGQVALDPEGNAVVVWNQLGSLSVFDLFANRSSGQTGVFGIEEKIEFIHSGHALEPHVAVDPEGNAVAVYRQHDGTRDNIWFNRFTPAGGWETAALIENRDPEESYRPQVALDADGNGIAVWEEWTADGERQIWASRYE